MAALDVDWPAACGEPKNQATWAILIVGVIFNHFTHHNRIAKLLYAYVTEDALIHSMSGELERPQGYFLADLLNQHSGRNRS